MRAIAISSAGSECRATQHGSPICRHSLRRVGGRGIGVGAGASGSARGPSPVRHPGRGRCAARTFSLNETGSLRLTSKHGFTLNEQGSASGTVTGTIYVHLTIVSTSRVTAEVNIYPRGGSISGVGTRAIAAGTARPAFSGSMSIARGTRELRARPRVGPELQRHDPALKRRGHRARQRQGLGLIARDPRRATMQSRDRMLELRDLVKHYPAVGGETVRAVDGVSLDGRARARWSRCMGRAGRARRRCC